MMYKNFFAGSALLAATAVSASDFTVDFSKEIGTIRRINGISNCEPLSSSRGGRFRGLLKPLEAPRTHLHDDALLNPGYAVVDVSRIFPLFHLDADDPKNYNFKPTDDYLKTAVEDGIEIDFRLGEAIEHSENQYRVHPPADPVKWADICSHIIRHYNEGWADGFKWNIRYWSIWEEPDTNPMLFDGPDPYYGAYFRLYKTVAPILKQRFPSIKISGPQVCSGTRYVRGFVEFCAKEKLPLDALGWTSYRLRPEGYLTQAKEFRAILDENGFKDTELNIVEWHYRPVSWNSHGMRMTKERKAEWERHLNSSDSSAFTAASLILMQDSPVTMMHFYSLKGDSWGIFDAGMQPQRPYYALVAFAQLAHGRTRVEAPLKPQEGWYALASKESGGAGHVLVSAFKSYGDLSIRVKGGLKPTKVRAVDTVHELAEVPGWQWDAERQIVRIPRYMCESVVWLVDFE